MAVEEIMRVLVDRLGTDTGLERVQAMLRIREGDEPRPHVPLQWGSELYMPGLTARPWHDPTDFPWTAEIEAEFQLIRAEYDRITETGIAQPYLAGFDVELHEHPNLQPHDALSSPAAEGVAWSVYFLIRHGQWISPNAEQCPHTCRAIARTPLSLGESLFSLLAPKSRISLHNGGWNIVLTCHLALHIPDDCAIRVGRETREWEPGKVLVFDDTFAHAAWNDSDRYRSCLIWDIWHPDLSPLEIEAIRVLLPLLRRRDEDVEVA